MGADRALGHVGSFVVAPSSERIEHTQGVACGGVVSTSLYFKPVCDHVLQSVPSNTDPKPAVNVIYLQCIYLHSPLIKTSHVILGHLRIPVFILELAYDPHSIIHSASP